MRKRNKLVFWVGINDADYAVKPMVGGKQSACVFYRAWVNMLSRCYSDKFQVTHQKYIGCTVCEEWLTFSNFKKWMERQDFKGKQLDKDIIVSGNKVYSPETCVFVSGAVNKLLNDHGAARGKHKQGVYFVKCANKFKSQISIGGNIKHLGYYSTEDKAYADYAKAKAAYIREIADTQEPKVKSALYRHAAELENTLKTED